MFINNSVYTVQIPLMIIRKSNQRAPERTIRPEGSIGHSRDIKRSAPFSQYWLKLGLNF